MAFPIIVSRKYIKNLLVHRLLSAEDKLSLYIWNEGCKSLSHVREIAYKWFDK